MVFCVWTPSGQLCIRNLADLVFFFRGWGYVAFVVGVVDMFCLVRKVAVDKVSVLIPIASFWHFPY